MQNQNEKSKKPEADKAINSNLRSTLWDSLNVATSAFTITTLISIFKLPIDNILIQMTQKNINTINLQSLASIGLMAGMGSYVRSNIPRSCYCLVSKNSTQSTKTKEIETGCIEASENIPEPMNEVTRLKKEIGKLTPYIAIPFFAAGETFLTHTPEQITNLKQRNIAYDWKKPYNYYVMTKSGLFLRYTSSLVNLLGLTHIQEIYSKMLFKKHDSISANLVSGALSGVTSAIISHPLRQVSLHVSISGNSDDKKTFLTFEKTSTICKKLLAELKQQTRTEIVKDALPKILLRSAQNALVFSVISAMSKILGPKPAEDVYDKLESFAPFKK